VRIELKSAQRCPAAGERRRVHPHVLLEIVERTLLQAPLEGLFKWASATSPRTT
jgi:hypothetical protein